MSGISEKVTTSPSNNSKSELNIFNFWPISRWLFFNEFHFFRSPIDTLNSFAIKYKYSPFLTEYSKEFWNVVEISTDVKYLL